MGALEVARIVPLNGEWFELTFSMDPELVLERSVFGRNPAWKYVGSIHYEDEERPRFLDKTSLWVDTRRQVTARIVHLPDFEGSIGQRISWIGSARRNAKRLGYELLPGQAAPAFMDQFPVMTSRAPIFFGGTEWEHALTGNNIVSVQAYGITPGLDILNPSNPRGGFPCSYWAVMKRWEWKTI